MAATQPAADTRPEELPGATSPQPAAAQSPFRCQTPRNPAPTRRRHQPLTPPRTGPETGSHHDSLAQPTTPVKLINQPATGPASTSAPAHAPHANAPARAQRDRPWPAAPQSQGPPLAQTLGGAHLQATTAGPTDAPTADRTQAVTGTAGCTPPGPRDPETYPEARAPSGAGALPTPPTCPKQDDPTENTGAGTQETAEGDSRGGPDAPRAELLAAMSVAEMDTCDRDLIHYDTDKELDSRRL